MRSLVVGLSLLATPALAQPPVTAPASALLFDHDGSGPVERFEWRMDNENWVAIQPTKEGGVTFRVAFPALTPGGHTVTVRACNAAGCAESDPLTFVVAITPGRPTSLRIGAKE